MSRREQTPSLTWWYVMFGLEIIAAIAASYEPSGLLRVGCILGIIAGIPQFLGRRREIIGVRRNARGECLDCGYDLRGNTSGICPECGQPIPSSPSPELIGASA